MNVRNWQFVNPERTLRGKPFWKTENYFRFSKFLLLCVIDMFTRLSLINRFHEALS